MKKVLLVSLAFPPLPAVGIFRIAKFCRYLPDVDWQPHVLTEKIRDVKVAKDWATLEDIGSHVKIVRTLNLQPFYWWDNRNKPSNPETFTKPPAVHPDIRADASPVTPTQLPIKQYIKSKLLLLRKTITVPDTRLAWIPQALIPGLCSIYKNNIDVIYSSSPPPTNHILAHLLSLLSGRPHVIEYRDLWTMNAGYYMRELPDYLKKYDAFWEKRVIDHSSGIVVVTNTFKKKMIDRFPNINPEKVAVIYNGVDPADFEDTNIHFRKNKRFTVSYFGNLYGFRNPSLFFEACANWIKSNPSLRDTVEINFWGSGSSSYLREISKYGLECIVSYKSRIPQKETFPKMLQSDLLLLIQGIDKRVADSIPTKLFEYMVTSKPILAFFPKGEAADIIKQRSENLVVSCHEIGIITEFLQKQYQTWLDSEQEYICKVEVPPEFDRRRQAQQLGVYLDKFVK